MIPRRGDAEVDLPAVKTSGTIAGRIMWRSICVRLGRSAWTISQSSREMFRSASWIWMEKLGSPLASRTNSARDSMSLNQMTAMMTHESDGTLDHVDGRQQVGGRPIQRHPQPDQESHDERQDEPGDDPRDRRPGVEQGRALGDDLPRLRGDPGHARNQKRRKKYDITCQTTSTSRKLAQYCRQRDARDVPVSI